MTGKRWGIGTAYLELKSAILGGLGPVGPYPEGIDQETHALLVVQQLLRTATADATSTLPGTDPGPGRIAPGTRRRAWSQSPFGPVGSAGVRVHSVPVLTCKTAW
ncbi:hypothetical protein [Streptomyces sulfonofaciens]|uniref:hypothetical protein n=1 Tax=Streptomyces sulfonofaciens TaxID=68272 RepID=UPI00167BF19E|nr:hypothetical protein [Streptomyces sulfonofaciens]